MKILMLNFEYPPLGGGGGVATKQIAEELARKHDVYVITSATSEAVDDKDTPVHVIRVPIIGRKELPTATFLSMLSYVVMAFIRGVSLCRGHSFDVLNAQFVLPSGVPAVFLSKLFRVPFVLSFIGGDIYDPTKGISPHRHSTLRMAIRWIAKQASICTAISEDTKRRAEQIHGVKKEIVVTHLGIVPQAVEHKERSELGMPTDALLAITIGRLIPRKGYMTLLAAWKNVPDVHLAILGDGPLKQEMNAYISSNDMQDRVHMLGFVSEVEKLQLLRIADLYVSAAKHEGFGIVFIEAMDAGLPIVATNDGGQKDFLTEENAILIPPDDASALQGAVSTFVTDDMLRKSTGERNAQKAKEFYISKTTAVFEKVLERGISLSRE